MLYLALLVHKLLPHVYTGFAVVLDRLATHGNTLCFDHTTSSPGAGLTSCESGRFISLGVPSSASGRMFVHIPQGFPYGLLVHDMTERFLLYFFTHSAHTNTRGTFTTPESTSLDRNGPGC